MDFIVALASPEESLVNALTKADLVLQRLGGRPGGTIGRDDVEGLAGRDVEDDEVPAQGGIISVRGLISDWRDATIEYHFPDFTAYLQIILWQAGCLNTLLHVDWRQIERMQKDRMVRGYHQALAALGTALNARGGLGDVELPLELIKPEMIPDLIFDRAAPLGLVAMAQISLHDLRQKAASHGAYGIEPVSGFYVMTKYP
jgi:hypothetical protein